MIAPIDPILGHALVGPLIQVDEEGDGVFLHTSHHRNAEAVGVKIAHVRDGKVPLVEGPPVVNECSGNFLIKSMRILQRPGPLHWLNILAENQPVRGPPNTINRDEGLSSPLWWCIDRFNK